MGITCENCGAPAQPGVLKCFYCSRPVSAELAKHAIPCPKCKEPNLWGAQRCVRCQDWIVVQCVFCGGISPHNQTACLNCKEPFAGAPERKARMDAERAAQQQREIQHEQHHQNIETAAVVGSVAASFLGGVAGGILEGLLDD